jgi:oxygen-independent coproporphyrinogen-3 oxidase
MSTPYYPELLARPVPRYTSYPTAVEFDPSVNAGAQSEALAQVNGAASLYVHIPYCQQICWYCGCNTGAANRTQRLTGYLDALDREIGLVAARLGDDVAIDRIAFGGGSPNALSPVIWVRLLDRLLTALRTRSPVLSIELDPRGFTDEWASVLGATSVRNVSLGIQSFDPSVQAAIGRVQPTDHITAVVSALRGAGVQSINFDLMYGLPHQNDAVLAATLAETVALRPDRIALFGYAHVPDLIPRQRQIDGRALPDAAQRFAMAVAGEATLVAAGYQPVGFDHFALPVDPLARAARNGTLRRNFQGFTDDDADVLIGLGASAISVFPDRLIQNEKNSGRYRMRLSQDALPGVRGVRRTTDDRQRALAIEDFLCGRPADLSAIDHDGAIADDFAPFVARGLAIATPAGIRFTPEGRPYARVMASLIDGHRESPVRRSSSAV